MTLRLYSIFQRFPELQLGGQMGPVLSLGRAACRHTDSPGLSCMAWAAALDIAQQRLVLTSSSTAVTDHVVNMYLLPEDDWPWCWTACCTTDLVNSSLLLVRLPLTLRYSLKMHELL